jgi:hypothetical protein
MTGYIPASAKQTLAEGRFSPLVPPLHGSDFYEFYFFRLLYRYSTRWICCIRLRVCLRSFWLWSLRPYFCFGLKCLLFQKLEAELIQTPNLFPDPRSS